MTSSNGNIFRVTGHLCEEFTGHRWILRTMANDAELLMFSLICTWLHGWVNNHKAGDLRRHYAHYDVTVMITFQPVSCVFQENKIVIPFHIIPRHWNITSYWNSHSNMSKVAILHTINITAADDLATSGVKASAAMILIKLSRNISV